jgi:single-stranded-DNA-specific exonuclease
VLLGGLEKAASILSDKIRTRAKIRIIGDYDIDGVCASYILWRGITELGGCADCDIPDRISDGYGLNARLIEKAFEQDADTILTCDNGISAISQIAYAKKLGMTVIVTDHHEPLYEETDGRRNWNLPSADALVDPKLPGDGYPFREICGAVVAWKLIQQLYRLFDKATDAYLDLLPAAAFATVGDVMDLRDENRIIVRYGLKALETTKQYGFAALRRACGLEGKTLSAYHIGFIMGPCLNAGGRLDTAKRSLALLMSSNAQEAEAFAAELKELNEERKDLTQQGIDMGCNQIEEGTRYRDKVYVVYLPSVHESIAGIIAGKLRERYNHPCIVLTDAQEPGMLKGSGRSIEAYPMFDGLVRCADLLEKFGGHPMAAGMSLKKENLELFRKTLNEQAELSEEDFRKKVLIDVQLPVRYLTTQFADALSCIEPCGKGNEKPLFAEKDLLVRRIAVIGRNRNAVRLQLEGEGGAAIEAMLFSDPEEFLGYIRAKFGQEMTERALQGRENSVRLSVTYYPHVNEYRGSRTLQIILSGYR